MEKKKAEKDKVTRKEKMHILATTLINLLGDKGQLAEINELAKYIPRKHGTYNFLRRNFEDFEDWFNIGVFTQRTISGKMLVGIRDYSIDKLNKNIEELTRKLDKIEKIIIKKK